MALNQTGTLAERAAPYLNYVEEWLDRLPPASLKEIIKTAGGPERVAVVSVDLIVGFCHSGALSSPRVAGILQPAADLMTRAHGAGIEAIVLTQDTHRPDAEEFASYPPHCIAGTEESETAPELLALPFADSFDVVEKNSIASTIAPAWVAWEQEHGPFAAWIVVGDCTDLCVYQAAMALKLRSLSEHRGERVVVPVDCVQTYDLPVEQALEIGTQPHDGDLLHAVFLHSMALNGVDVVATVS
ncbi:MAG TPA: isochorismatase family protein [Thermomicrobiales bacterium]|nr:isochorismatase family protein [Thermomicrobiales bacterium]